jgi:small conductance mechanosensitive channel
MWFDNLATLIVPALIDLLYVLLIVPAALLAFAFLSRLLAPVIWWMFRARYRVRQAELTHQRAHTLKRLIASVADMLAFLFVLIFLLSRFIQPGTIATTIGLFSAGIGIAARPFISDLLGGLVLLFEDQYTVGEKVEIGDKNVIGVVEQVTLRVTAIRGEAGELWIVPNGDVRSLRNFSRSSFSLANIKITVPTSHLDETLAILADIAGRPDNDIIETPEVISEQGAIADRTELMLKVKAVFGHGAIVRRRLLSLIQQELFEHRILANTQDAQNDMTPTPPAPPRDDDPL